jgi:hypothetical protein
MLPARTGGLKAGVVVQSGDGGGEGVVTRDGVKLGAEVEVRGCAVTGGSALNLGQGGGDCLVEQVGGSRALGKDSGVGGAGDSGERGGGGDRGDRAWGRGVGEKGKRARSGEKGDWKRKRVVQINVATRNIERRFNSVADAAECEEVTYQQMYYAVNHLKQLKGFVWRYEDSSTPISKRFGDGEGSLQMSPFCPAAVPGRCSLLGSDGQPPGKKAKTDVGGAAAAKATTALAAPAVVASGSGGAAAGATAVSTADGGVPLKERLQRLEKEIFGQSDPEGPGRTFLHRLSYL